MRTPNDVSFCGNVAKIFDLHGDECIIDAEDYDVVCKYRWCKDGYGYWMTKTCGRAIKLHRLICKISDPELIVDHINKDISDNRKENLRVVNKKQNAYNHKINTNNVSGFIGVSKRILADNKIRWDARISVNGKSIHIGSFDNIDDAIIARLLAEMQYFGEFAPQRDLFEQYGVAK